jgi:hypothetical protein
MIENIDRRLLQGNQNGIQKNETETTALCTEQNQSKVMSMPGDILLKIHIL